MRFKILIFTFTVATMFSGCALKNSNLFGVGYDKSTCESSQGFGVCGTPKNIYKYRDKIRKVQDDYFRASYKDDLFFSIDNYGRILVKSDRNGKWMDYETSPYKRKIERLIQEKDEKLRALKRSQSKADHITGRINLDNNSLSSGGDLSVVFKDQSHYIQTHSQAGNFIRDNGEILPSWFATYEDTSGDLVTAHEVMVVVRKPQWVIGEKTPKNVSIKNYTTPLSNRLFKEDMRSTVQNEATVADFTVRNTDPNKANSYKAEKVVTPEDIEIDNFLKE